MALVQYDLGSSDSDADDEDSETTEVTKPVERQPIVAAQKRHLKNAEINNDDKEQQVSKKIKIAIPKIIDDKIDEHEADEMIPKVSSKLNPNETSGLLTKLPAPKNAPKIITTTSFIPYTLTKKPVTKPPSKVAKAKLLAAKAKAANKNKTSIKNVANDDSDDDDDEIASNFDEDIWSQICCRPKKQHIVQPTISEPQEIHGNVVPTVTEEPERPSLKLDNVAFQQLVGSSKRRQQIGSDVTITDITDSDMLEKTDVWMRKALTDPQYQQKHTSDDSDTTNPVAKNKHHITFLAHQAKAKEQELQAQWATGNQKRQMSRSKYGF